MADADRFAGRSIWAQDLAGNLRGRQLHWAAAAATLVEYPIAALVTAVRVGRYLVCVLQSGSRVARRAIRRGEPAHGEHLVRHGVLPGRRDRTERRRYG